MNVVCMILGFLFAEGALTALVSGNLVCNPQQQLLEGICCNKCPPGHKMTDCTSDSSTDCVRCSEGYFMDDWNVVHFCLPLDACNKPYEYIKVASSNGTTNNICDCIDGYEYWDVESDKSCVKSVPSSPTPPPLPQTTTVYEGNMTAPPNVTINGTSTPIPTSSQDKGLWVYYVLLCVCGIGVFIVIAVCICKKRKIFLFFKGRKARYDIEMAETQQATGQFPTLLQSHQQ